MELLYEEHRIRAVDDDGTPMGEITFSPAGEGRVCFDHTYVDPRFEGRGVAGQMMAAAVDQVRARGWKATAACSYARAWLEKHPDQAAALK